MSNSTDKNSDTARRLLRDVETISALSNLGDMPDTIILSPAITARLAELGQGVRVRIAGNSAQRRRARRHKARLIALVAPLRNIKKSL